MKFLRTIGLGFVLAILLAGQTWQASEARQPKVPMTGPFSEAQSKGACRKDSSLTFSEEQTKEFADLQRAYLAEAKPLWNELRTLRLDMSYAVTDPQTKSQVLLGKQMKVSAIRAKFENLRFAYLIKARAIFTKEQLERFPADCPLKVETVYRMGGSRWLPKGVR